MSFLDWKIGDLVEFRLKKGEKSKLGIYLGTTRDKRVMQDIINIVLIEDIRILEIPLLCDDDLFYTRIIQSFSNTLS